MDANGDWGVEVRYHFANDTSGEPSLIDEVYEDFTFQLLVEVRRLGARLFLLLFWLPKLEPLMLWRVWATQVHKFEADTGQREFNFWMNVGAYTRPRLYVPWLGVGMAKLAQLAQALGI